ncbi:hypothetical protein OIU34_03125 [Pararhizobium sp. BT-229]|uniref:hypothetical protein n=1 Tax=Pararhizobium sp. BT-229 TaxID=2986923 RepID=UPI0021F73ED8|nr:hypothetical protein [Pararhizobium sp. BT-229]MCV9960883.1 hypothetical protein [Pararhizobium sp. BT-229]
MIAKHGSARTDAIAGLKVNPIANEQKAGLSTSPSKKISMEFSHQLPVAWPRQVQAASASPSSSSFFLFAAPVEASIIAMLMM